MDHPSWSKAAEKHRCQDLLHITRSVHGSKGPVAYDISSCYNYNLLRLRCYTATHRVGLFPSVASLVESAAVLQPQPASVAFEGLRRSVNSLSDWYLSYSLMYFHYLSLSHVVFIDFYQTLSISLVF